MEFFWQFLTLGILILITWYLAIFGEVDRSDSTSHSIKRSKSSKK